MDENSQTPVPGVDENESTSTPAPDVEVTEAAPEQPATTAGEQNHAKPDRYRGDEADAPADTGSAPQEG